MLHAARTQESRTRRRALRDWSVRVCGGDKSERIDLGLNLLSLASPPGEVFTLDEIAAWCGCTPDAILLIQRRAQRKLAHTLRFGRHAGLVQEVSS